MPERSWSNPRRWSSMTSAHKRYRIPNVRNMIDWHAVPVDFAQWSTTGVIGDARHASAPLGARLWDACVHQVARVIAAAANRQRFPYR